MIPVITIDGPVASGKGTVAAKIAQKLHWHLLDSGALYRALAWTAAKKQIELHDEATLLMLSQNLDVQFELSSDGSTQLIKIMGKDANQEIRTEAMGLAASVLAQKLTIRKALLTYQHHFLKPPGLVADGRDMGTVVFPNASLKIYLTASVEARAQRRTSQLLVSGKNAILSDVLADISHRDEQDLNRLIAPLKPAADALIIDSSILEVEEVVSIILKQTQQRSLID